MFVYVCVCLRVPTEELAVQAYSQPAFLTSLMNLQRTTTCQLSLVLSCLHCSLTHYFLFLVFFPPALPLLPFVCLNRSCLCQCGGFCLHQLTSFPYLFWVHILHIPINPQGSKWSKRDLAVIYDVDYMNFFHSYAN